MDSESPRRGWRLALRLSAFSLAYVAAIALLGSVLLVLSGAGEDLFGPSSAPRLLAAVLLGGYFGYVTASLSSKVLSRGSALWVSGVWALFSCAAVGVFLWVVAQTPPPASGAVTSMPWGADLALALLPYVGPSFVVLPLAAVSGLALRTRLRSDEVATASSES